MQTIDHALSIGPNCRAKYQLRRHFERYAVNGVFDWQITPASSCIAYLEADFIGLFDRDDLEIRAGALRNRRWGTAHLHEIPALTDAALDEHYAAARSRHDHVCNNFRTTIRSGRRVLLAFSREIDDPTRLELVAALEAYAGATQLFFVFEPKPDHPAPTWRGDDRTWDALLAPYRLGLWPSLVAAGMRTARAVRDHLPIRRNAPNGTRPYASDPLPEASADG